MKRFIQLYTTLALLILGAACSKSESYLSGSADGVGTMAITISTQDAQSTRAYDPLAHVTVRIYNDEGGLIRKYTALSDIPARLELLAGEYTVAVEAGEEVDASFDTRFYKGEKTFSVTAGNTTPVAVVCQPANVIVAVQFDQSVGESFDAGYSAWVALDDAFDLDAAQTGAVPALKYTADGTGYFTLPEGTTTLSWFFSGEHSARGEVTKTDRISDIRTAGKYTLTFRYSPDLPGFIEALLVRVDETTEDHDDTFVLRDEPTITGDGFDLTADQQYTSGNRVYHIEAASAIEQLSVSIDGQTFDALNGSTAGIGVVSTDETNIVLTLSDAFFAGRAGGDHTVSVSAVDANDGNASVQTTYRLQGLFPMAETDYDLWSNTLTLRAVAFDTATVSFALREDGGAWNTQSGTRAGDVVTVVFAPEWEDKTTPDWSTPNTNSVLPYARLVAGTGIFAGHTYDYKVTIDSAEQGGQFTTVAGNTITNGNFDTWKDGNYFPCTETGTTIFNTKQYFYDFWGSGYNDFLKTLCTRDETIAGRDGAYAAKLTASYNNMAGIPAPGNLFSANFAVKTSPMGGEVHFGKPFTYNARPRAIKFRYHATIGAVDYNQHGGPLAVGETDKARIYVAITEWSAAHTIFAGKNAPTGTWDPEKQTSVTEGAVIGYASKFIEETTAGSEMVEVVVPINYYDKNAAAPQGNFTIVLSCSTSAFGDYMNACSTNVMYVDAFEWVY